MVSKLEQMQFKIHLQKLLQQTSQAPAKIRGVGKLPGHRVRGWGVPSFGGGFHGGPLFGLPV